MKKLSIILAILLLSLLAERFIFHTTKIEYKIDPPVLKANPNSEMTLEIIPENSLGFKTPFAKREVRFEIEEGENLIELNRTMENNKAIIRSKGIEGEVVLGIYSLKSGILLNKILIKIISGNLAFMIVASEKPMFLPVSF